MHKAYYTEGGGVRSTRGFSSEGGGEHQMKILEYHTTEGGGGGDFVKYKKNKKGE